VQPASGVDNTATKKAASNFVIDAVRSTFTVQAFSTGFLSALGHNPRIAVRNILGDVRFVSRESALEDVRVHVSIDPRSLEVVDDISDKDRREIHRQMYDDVLDVDRYPEIIYDCSRVTINGSGDQLSSLLTGDLTLHGETHPLAVSARVAISGDVLKASGDFSVSQREYGIPLVSVAGGAIKLKDEVKCAFNIVARKQA